MNKYQDSIDRLMDILVYTNDENKGYYKELLDCLQELVNWYDAFNIVASDYTKKMIENYLEKLNDGNDE